MAANKLDGSMMEDVDASKLTGSIDAARIPEAAVTQHVTPFDPAQLEMNQAMLAFKIASSNQLAKFQMVDQVIDEYQDATGIDAGNSTEESVGGTGTGKYYYGGSVGSSSTTVVKSYTGSNQAWTVPADVSTVTFKAWGAGGGGGGAGAVGGGGGFVQDDITVSPSESLNIKVGGGGQFVSNGGSNKGGGGGWSSIDRAGTYLAGAGGGGGAGAGSSELGGGGGGTSGLDGAGAGAGHEGTGGTQSAGGVGANTSGNGTRNTGGNSPDGSASDATGGYNGGGKGDGDNVSWTGGGGGGGYWGGGSGGNPTGAKNGGGGGGSGYAPNGGTNTAGTSGGVVANAGDANYQAGTGDGGTTSGHGENGAVVLIYTPIAIANLTLQSTATTAESAPTTADLVVLIEDGAGTTTVNTDIKGFVSRDGSAFSSAVTFVDEGDWGTNKRILVARNIDISGITTGTAMKYKLTTHNQVASSLETRIHATSLAWS